ncbi:isoleucyl-tRNA synthetase [Capsaspora owczarzaki ATCC 30864]|uniref:isoleucine--tRNA ligase n=1 Tax=Capsaspora owczarzaki (strain ATCC 30864) TaxID=595528 RepID=A0A0D2VX34_CAPO3|nr:isoleucyl-tRNA synthetase [Capsaspora owczarzaki ATCC 30864]KJE96152.1 isoleucyl-tRNA synthetase [Capsaspora owczarzaki ATCC 30864]|eukprot:XP_004345266.2 isoleucyl-tRNA synthetase [Capsaspora owczarzaki ATCC 30864]
MASTSAASASASASASSPLPSVSDNHNFPGTEEAVLGFWKSINAFETSLKLSEGRKPYTFYDGPPFATGKPHYGHILAGTIKDIVTRWAHQTGHYVERRFGWDTHGLPIEFEIDKAFNINSPQDVEKMGIANYNEKCRNIVMTFAKEWETTVNRMGRWIDFQNDYKTMYPSFMESVWWVFSQLFDKDLVYRGYKVMPFSTGCATPLSNFEAGQNYRDVSDPAIMITFPLVDQPEVSLVAWTTTPWTLPSNLALCVNPELEYVKVKDTASGKIYILATDRLVALYPKGKESGDAHGKAPTKAATGAAAGKAKGKEKKQQKRDDAKTGASSSDAADSAAVKEETPAAAAAAEPAAAAAETVAAAPAAPYEILERFKGATLKGLRYTPLFPYFASRPGAFVVTTDPYVTNDSGTGVVHSAPGFGEDDYRVCVAHGIVNRDEAVPCPIDEKGCFTSEVTDFVGKYVKDADKDVIKHIKDLGRLVNVASIVHSYPFCWRSNTPLIYRAVGSWFVRVESLIPRLLANNAQTYWVPDVVKEKRFANWLANARDWSISRNRYWGTPIPLWVSDDGKEVVRISSIQELHELSGVLVTDLHREFLDDITIPSKQGKGVLRRTKEVFDCWFESGSMPYAQVHYPFERKDTFQQSFPADFIAEGLDQTRGWFYTLLVISTALFDKPPFKNLIVNGLVLAADGQKMSKSKKNYPDPSLVIDNYGADALRLYLINSPVVRAEEVKFKEAGVKDVIKDVLLPWYNAFRFCLQNVDRLKKEDGIDFTFDLKAENPTTNLMDKWILAYTQSLITFVKQEMAAYRLYTVVPRLLAYIDNLTNWYVRFNRRRVKGEAGLEECKNSLGALFEVLFTTVTLMAPFTPFIAEYMYQNLLPLLTNLDPNEDRRSVHFTMIPEPKTGYANADIERVVARMQSVIEMVRVVRDRRNLPVKYPLSEMTLVHSDKQVLDDVRLVESYLLEELNVKTLVTSSDIAKYGVKLNAAINMELGAKLRGDLPVVQKAIAALSADDIEKFKKEGTITVAGFALSGTDLKISYSCTAPADHEANTNGDILVLVNVVSDSGMKEEGLAREIINRVQRLRKKGKLIATDNVDVYYQVTKEDAETLLTQVVVSQADFLATNLKLVLKPHTALPAGVAMLVEEESEIKSASLKLWISSPHA